MPETSLTNDSDRAVRDAWLELRNHLELVRDVDERLGQVSALYAQRLDAACEGDSDRAWECVDLLAIASDTLHERKERLKLARPAATVGIPSHL